MDNQKSGCGCAGESAEMKAAEAGCGCADENSKAGCGRAGENSKAGCCAGEGTGSGNSRKMTVRTDEQKKKLLNRLKRIEGQVCGIQRMIEEDAYCNDILIQSAAVNAAMNAFNKELLASHIRSCVARDIRDGKDEVIDELVQTLQKLMK